LVRLEEEDAGEHRRSPLIPIRSGGEG
jgi:hypothetical protein